MSRRELVNVVVLRKSPRRAQEKIDQHNSYCRNPGKGCARRFGYTGFEMLKESFGHTRFGWSLEFRRKD